jgi:DnaJ family protein A protein 2
MYAQSQEECVDCNGKGNNLDEKDKCESCKGEKVIKEEKEFEVKLDSGASDNQLYKFPSEGNQIV